MALLVLEWAAPDRSSDGEVDLRPGWCAAPTSTIGPRLEPPSLEPVESISPVNLRRWIDWLTAPEHGGRRAATGTTPAIADALGRYLVAVPPGGLGLTPIFGQGPCQPFDVLGHREVNVIATLHSGPTPTATVLLGAHYDGQGRHPTRGPLPGADDNASGVAAVLEAARLLSHDPPRDTDVVIVLFGAEELGLAGSRHWLDTRGEQAPPDVALILDMVGRPLPIDDGVGFALRAHASTDRLPELVDRASEATTIPIEPIDRLGSKAPGDSDDTPFAEAGLDVALVTSGLHADYHDVGDTAEAVDLDQVERAARWLVALVRVVDSATDIDG
ncbi:MAG: M20/M25/M40 family metallo-hydrolase [Acidobacteriota bacterium]